MSGLKKAGIAVGAGAGNEESRKRLLEEINLWFASAQGRSLLALQEAVLDELLPTMFGYHLVQLGPLEQSLFKASQVGSRVRLGLGPDSPADLAGNPLELPFQDDSIDVVLLHHALDFIAGPRELLREAARVTLPSGHLILLGFNPFSFWGLARLLPGLRGRPPWNGAFLRTARLFDWLDLLNFRIDRVIYGLHGPGSLSARVEIPDFSRGLSRHTNWPFGAVYMVVARKWVGATPALRPNWRQRPAMAKLQLVERRTATLSEHGRAGPGRGGAPGIAKGESLASRKFG